jgi:hypothetical protein
MIQNVSLIEETIQRGVESGGFAGKIGEQAYLNEALSTLDFRGEAGLGRKEFTQRVSVSVEVLPWSVFPVGGLCGRVQAVCVWFVSLCRTLCRLRGEPLLRWI